jgi:caffeoyl-CoA O-methyltransferase
MTDLPKQLEQYILSLITKEDPLLSQLNRETWRDIYHPRQLSGHLQGRILSMISHMIQPRSVLEIGTFTGYSALCLAEGMPNDGLLHTIELNDELESFIQSYFDQSEHKEKIKLHIGDAREIIPKLQERFDLVFIDGNKSQYVEYYQLIFDRVNPGGYIIADNVLWDGKIIQDEIRKGDHFTRGILTFNEMVSRDDRVEKVIFPIRDGMFVVRKKSERKHPDQINKDHL